MSDLVRNGSPGHLAVRFFLPDLCTGYNRIGWSIEILWC